MSGSGGGPSNGAGPGMSRSNEDILAAVRQLAIPDPFDRDALVRSVAEMRDRPIAVLEIDTDVLADSPCGLWVARDSEDLIFLERRTSEYHKQQCLFHEVGHMLLGHGPGGLDVDRRREMDMLRNALPDVDPASVIALMGRSDFVGEEEHDAEMFAHLLRLAITEKRDGNHPIRGIFFRSR